MKKKKEKIVIVMVIVALVLVTVGVSYAAFTYVGQGQRENLVRTGNLTFNYDEKESTNQLSLTNAFPMTNEKGKEQTNYFDFDVDASTRGAPINYEIYLTKVDTSTLDETVVKTYLTSLENDAETEVTDPLNKKAVNFFYMLGDSKVPNQTGGKTLYQETIEEGQTNYHKTFRYRMWIYENASEINGNGEWIHNNKIFTVRVNVYASNGEIGLPTRDWPRMKSYATVNEYGNVTSVDEDFRLPEVLLNITSIKYQIK